MEKSDDVTPVKDVVLALERAALDRWGKGDPEGYLEVNAPDITYFDPFVQHRVDGIAALKAWYEPIREKIQIDSDEIIDPHVQVIGDVAVLTFHYVSHGSEGVKRWNCTEVYRRSGSGWKIVHSTGPLPLDKLKTNLDIATVPLNVPVMPASRSAHEIRDVPSQRIHPIWRAGRAAPVVECKRGL